MAQPPSTDSAYDAGDARLANPRLVTESAHPHFRAPLDRGGGRGGHGFSASGWNSIWKCDPFASSNTTTVSLGSCAFAVPTQPLTYTTSPGRISSPEESTPRCSALPVR